jgi:hypothetical protein
MATDFLSALKKRFEDRLHSLLYNLFIKYRY